MILYQHKFDEKLGNVLPYRKERKHKGTKALNKYFALVLCRLFYFSLSK